MVVIVNREWLRRTNKDDNQLLFSAAFETARNGLLQAVPDVPDNGKLPRRETTLNGLREKLAKAEIPSSVVTRYPVPGARSEPAIVVADIAFPELKLAMFFDGIQEHASID